MAHARPALAAGRALPHGSPPASERFDDEVAEVFVDDGCVDVSDLWPLGQPVDHEGVERAGVRDGDMEEKVVASGDDEDPDGNSLIIVEPSA